MGGSIALARAAARAGIRTIVATPHVSARYQNSSILIHGLVEDVNTRLASEEVPVQVMPGAEVAADQIADLDADEIANSSLGGGGWLLLEPPFTPATDGFDEIALALMREGHRVMIAHPERCPAFHRDVAPLRRLVEAGAATSITAGSLAGRFGKRARKSAMQLFDGELVHNVASDAHDELMRPPRLFAEIADAGLGDLSEWLTEVVPAAILAGEEIPARPTHARRSWRRPSRLLRGIRRA